MKKSTIYRAIFYIAGLLILALGIVLNTKSGLGVSPIISISYSVSVIYGLNFGNATFGLYAVFVAVEIMLHLIRRPEVVNVLRQDEERGEYLHFKVAEVLQIQNLLENMIYSLVTGKGDQNRINQTTMGLIFLYLLESVQYAEMRLPNQYENMIAMTTLDYIEQQYRTATLTELCEQLHLPMHIADRWITVIRCTTDFDQWYR